MTNSTIGQRIAENRKSLGFSQEALGEKLSVSRQAISKWESDSAIPEIDKLIALSKLFGVSVGWLLGIEELTKPEEAALSNEQLTLIEQIVQKYAPKPLITKWQQILAVCMTVSIFLSVFSLLLINSRQDAAIERKLDTAAYTSLHQRVVELESQLESARLQLSTLAAQPRTQGQLLADYTLDPYPLAATKSGRRVKVSFSAVPHIWSTGDTGYLCVSGGAEPFRIKCAWDGGHLSAEAILEIADGYDLCFAVEHSDGSQEQQVLEHEIIENLQQAFTVPSQTTKGTPAYEDGAVVLRNYATWFSMPAIYELIKEGHAVATCEYRLYRSPHNSSEYQIFHADTLDAVTNDPIPGFPFKVAAPEIRFENVDIQNCSHLQLTFYIQLDNGIEQERSITSFLPNGRGGITE